MPTIKVVTKVGVSGAVGGSVEGAIAGVFEGLSENEVIESVLYDCNESKWNIFLS